MITFVFRKFSHGFTGHEVQTMGYYFHYFMREDTEHPMVITIFSGTLCCFLQNSSNVDFFSAPNYCDMYGNDAAVLRITQEAYEVIQAEQVDHPFYLPDFCDAINYTLPFVFEERKDFSCFTCLILPLMLIASERSLFPSSSPFE